MLWDLLNPYWANCSIRSKTWMAVFSGILLLRAPSMNLSRIETMTAAMLLAHGLAQNVGLSQRKAGHLAGDLHHLFLVDDDAIGLLENLLQDRVRIAHLDQALLALDKVRDHVHRARAVERVQGDQILEALRLQAAQFRLHARRFQTGRSRSSCLRRKAR